MSIILPVKKIFPYALTERTALTRTHKFTGEDWRSGMDAKSGDK